MPTNHNNYLPGDMVHVDQYSKNTQGLPVRVIEWNPSRSMDLFLAIDTSSGKYYYLLKRWVLGYATDMGHALTLVSKTVRKDKIMEVYHAEMA